ncbi:MAG: hypothetical protein ACJAXN_003084 [Psychromonas sp.]|jgi:hypothetical protein
MAGVGMKDVFNKWRQPCEYVFKPVITKGIALIGSDFLK